MKKYQHNFTSPLRYPGGKAALSNFVKMLLLQNELVGSEYIEVFAGGAGIAWTLLFDNYVSKVHINDLSQPLFAFWTSVLFYTDGLSKMICDTEVTIDEWTRQKSIQESKSVGVLELGFSTLFLNRTNRSGILAGGIIGGKKQKGRWKLDARFNKRDLIARIERIAEQAPKINIYNMDAAEFINGVLPRLPRDSFVYLDPPYYVKGKGLYENYYAHDDHVKISNLVKNSLAQSWILSYDNCSAIGEMYKGRNKIEYGIIYTAQDKYSGSEVMYFSDNLVIPTTDNPTKVKAIQIDQVIA